MCSASTATPWGGRAGDEALVRARVRRGRPGRSCCCRRVGPVDVLGVHRHADGVGRAGDEALVRVRAVQVGPADRVGARFVQ